MKIDPLCTVCHILKFGGISPRLSSGFIHFKLSPALNTHIHFYLIHICPLGPVICFCKACPSLGMHLPVTVPAEFAKWVEENSSFLRHERDGRGDV